MKKKCLLLFFIIITLFLVSCSTSNGFSSLELENGYTLENDVIKKIVFDQDSIEPLKDIRMENAKIGIYEDQECKKQIDNVVSLKDGANIFYLKFTNQNNKSKVYTLDILNIRIKDLELKEMYNVEYKVGSVFDKESISLYGTKSDGQKVKIDDYDVEYNFEKIGDSLVTIKVGNLVYEYIVSVSDKVDVVLNSKFKSSDGIIYKFTKDKTGFYISDAKEYIGGEFICPKNVFYEGKEYPVLGISDYAFEENDKITSIKCDFPCYIGEGAFCKCSNLKMASFGDGCTFSSFVFDNCKKLEKIDLPNDLKEISNNMFSRCYSLRSIDLPNDIQLIGSQAFYECKLLENIYIPQKVSLIGSRAFKNCISLKYASVGAGTEMLSEGVFANCSNLEILLIPALSNFEDASIVENDEKVVVYTGKSSPILYYLKSMGTKYVSINDNSLYILNDKTSYSLNDDLDISAITVLVYKDDEILISNTFGYKYNFSIPGKSNVEIYANGISKNINVFVDYVKYFYSDDMDYSIDKFVFDYSKNYAYLESLLDTEEYILPTRIYKDDVGFDVKGILKDSISNLDSLKRIVLGSEIELIEEDAIHSNPNLSDIYISVPIGQQLNVGENNFYGLSDDLIIQTTYNNSIMHIYVRTHKLKYCGVDINTFYVSKNPNEQISYNENSKIDETQYYYVYVDFDLKVNRLDANDIDVTYDFSKSNVVVFKYKEYEYELKVKVE